MTTITQPTLSHRATTESFLAAAFAAVLLFVVLAWAQTWSVRPVNSAPLGDLPAPTAQAQVAPPRPAQQPTATDAPDAATRVPNAAPTPTSQAQIAAPQRLQQPAPTE